MKPIVEQIDSFLEDLFNGDIITVMYEKIAPSGKEAVPAFLAAVRNAKTPDESPVNMIGDFGRLFAEYINTEPSSGREKIALEFYNQIIAMRVIGFFQNNPNNLKELSFYRSRAELQAKDIQERDEQITGAMETIKKLRAELAGKEMFK